MQEKIQTQKTNRVIPRLDNKTIYDEISENQYFECIHCDFFSTFPEDIGYHCSIEHEIPFYDDEGNVILVD